MDEISFSTKQKLFYNKLQQLLKSKTFNDVTFNCKDGKTRGNRLLLSVYSSVLKDVFKENPLLAEHPKSHPENGIVLLQSSVYDVNNLLNILNSRNAVELNSHSLTGVRDIAKVFDIKLVTKNIENNRLLVKAVVQKGSNDSNEKKTTKLKQETEVNVAELDESHADEKRNVKRASNRNDRKAEPKEDESEAEDELGEEVHAQPAAKSRLSRSSGITNGSQSAKNSTNMFIEDKYYSIQQVKGQRFYKCKLCPKSYENVSRIRNHFQVKHLTLMFRCTKCSEKFDTRYNVVKHVKTEHKIFRGWRHFYTHTIIGSDNE